MVSVGYLLDTNVLSEPIRKAPDPRVIERLHLHQDQMATASVVWHELPFGVQRLPHSRKRSLIERYLADVVVVSVPIYPYDTPASGWHATERARLSGVGSPSSFSDGQIAAIAAVNDLALVTDNVRHFAPFRGLRVECWHQR